MQQLSFIYLMAAIASVTAFVPLQPMHSASRGMPSVFMAESVEEASMDAIDKMEKSIESVLQNMNTIRTGRASPAILDRVKADYYGVESPINQMATISVPSAQQLTVEPFDKSMLGEIERALMESDVGLTPMNDGNVIRLNIPSLTEERRKEMMKQCKAIGEEGKVAVRNIRRKAVDTIKKLEKDSEISEDESKSSQDEIQKMTDDKVKEIDGIVEKKEKEVMTV
ncbi:unnamed protein product [Pseudo-nitzschia multistriata]|uniref:Ribosome recycling factor domain-containing protein n=1 Tax=Pseudo-nitzschia multistriata TaxID=183589 RepID=A0A448Z4Q4_9STRA|nr:unnamed protein product [Pseudo-nitzschia multistriata]